MANEMTDRIRAAVEKYPRKMTLQLARDLGVPEVEVIRAFPADRVMELDITRWQELLQSFEAFGSVRVLVSNGATTIEAVFVVEKPGHMNGTATRSFQFFDQTGAAAFKVFLNFGGPIPPEREALLTELRSRFKR